MAQSLLERVGVGSMVEFFMHNLEINGLGLTVGSVQELNDVARHAFFAGAEFIGVVVQDDALVVGFGSKYDHDRVDLMITIEQAYLQV